MKNETEYKRGKCPLCSCDAEVKKPCAINFEREKCLNPDCKVEIIYKDGKYFGIKEKIKKEGDNNAKRKKVNRRNYIHQY